MRVSLVIIIICLILMIIIVCLVSGDKLDLLLAEHFRNSSLKSYQLSEKDKERLVRTCKHIKHALSSKVDVCSSYPFD